MKKNNFIITWIFFLIPVMLVQAQLPGSFTNIAGIKAIGGDARGVAVSGNGTVFFANSSDGLYAYNFDGISFKGTAHFTSETYYGDVETVKVVSDSIVLSTGFKGLSVFKYDGGTLVKTDYADVKNSSEHPFVEVLLDSLIFLIGNNCCFNQNDGIQVFALNNGSLTKKIDMKYSHLGKYAKAVKLINDSTLIIAFNNVLEAFRYDGNTITLVDSINGFAYPEDLEMDSRGNIFLSSNTGLDVYNFVNDNFNLVSQFPSYYLSKIAVSSDNTVFLASIYLGLKAFRYNGTTLTQIAYIENEMRVGDIFAGKDNLIFLANARRGLVAYKFTGNSFNYLGHINDGGCFGNIATASNNTVFLSNSFGNLSAFSYTDTSFNLKAKVYGTGIEPIYEFAPYGGLAVFSDSIVFHCRSAEGLFAYKYNGTLLKNTGNVDDGGKAMGVTVSSNGTVFLANYDDGLYAYSFDGSSFTTLAHINDGGMAMNVFVDQNGTVFLANGEDGIRVYSFDGTSFTNTAHINDGGLAFDIAETNNGIILLANGKDGLRSYTYDGASLTNTAHYYDFSENYAYAYDVEVSQDGTIFLTTRTDGLRALTFDGSTFTNTAHVKPNYHSLAVSVAGNGKIFLVGTEYGLLSYDYSKPVSISPVTGENNIQVYPNPVKDYLYIKNKFGKTELTLYNLQGSTVKYRTLENNDHKLDMYNVSPGIYILKIKSGDKLIVNKIVKE